MSLLSLKRRAGRVRVVGMGSHGVGWPEVSAGGSLRWQTLAWKGLEATSCANAIHSVVDRIGLEPGDRVTWVLSPSLIRHWLQTPPTQTACLSELHEVSRARAWELFNKPSTCLSESASDWMICAKWDAVHPFLCAAAPAAWVQALSATGKSSFRLQSPLLLALSCYQNQLPEDGWLAVVAADELHLLHRRSGRYTSLRSLRIALTETVGDAQWLAVREWQREMIRTRHASAQLHWLCLDNLGSGEIRYPQLQPIPLALACEELPLELLMPATGDGDERSGKDALLAAWCGHALLTRKA